MRHSVCGKLSQLEARGVGLTAFVVGSHHSASVASCQCSGVLSFLLPPPLTGQMTKRQSEFNTWTITKPDIRKTSHVWELTDLSMMLNEVRKIYSDPFVDTSGRRWKMCITAPKVILSKYFGLYIHLLECEAAEVRGTYLIETFNNDQKLTSKTSRMCTWSVRNVVGTSRWLTKSQLGHQIKVVLEISTFQGILHKKVMTSSAHRDRDLKSDITKLYLDQETSDFAIVARDSVLRAHSTILCSRSEVFRNLVLSKENKCILIEYNSDIVSKFLHFIYTDMLEPNFEDCLQLLILSNLFKVPLLGKLCSSFISDKITEQKCYEQLSAVVLKGC
ncbi:uncharacterized protein LOC135394490 [Ornithodoros turicata]|uniref:uncharacterized protein LOC135394490 n=1 Tax=Ornithodoros turicata TaxID=34597 RepID=UPI003138C3DF